MATYTGNVTRIDADGVVYVVVDGLHEGAELAAAVSVVGVAGGDRVLVDTELNGVADNVAVIGRVDGPDRRYSLTGHGH